MDQHDHASATPIDEGIRRVLAKHPRILFAVLFGSLAKNAASTDSDLDLAVSADGPLDVNERLFKRV